MDKVTRVLFNPILRDKEQVQAFLVTLPIGSAHPFRKELLVHSAANVVIAIDISMHSDDYFTKAVSLCDLGEQVLERMRLFPQELGVFNAEYQIQQAPASFFQVPIVNGLIHIFAVSVRDPTYYDLCVGDSEFRTCCFNAQSTFSGMKHSGDCQVDSFLLQHIKLQSDLGDTPRTVFVSGYRNHALHRYKKHNPVVLVANHSTKTLHVVPVPLDTATIGQDATLCCPLVIRKDASNNTLLCYILPAPTIDKNIYCTKGMVETTAFSTAITRADALPEQPHETHETPSQETHAPALWLVQASLTHSPIHNQHVIVATYSSTIDHLKPCLPFYEPGIAIQGSASHTDTYQTIRFGKGLDWMPSGQLPWADQDTSSVILPCILGGILQGPMLLAVGEPAKGVPFSNMEELHEYYRQSKSVIVLADEKMTDNARNVATTWRLNGLFILQTNKFDTPDDGVDVVRILDQLNVNAITALAGPQSLVLAQLGAKYFFYRGIANPRLFNASGLEYGQEVTNLISIHGLTSLAEQVHHPSWPRLVDLARDNPVHLPKTSMTMSLGDIRRIFQQRASMDDEIMAFKDDIAAVIPQLQVLLSPDKLQEICEELIGIVSAEVNDYINPLRREYSTFVVRDFDPADNESNMKKNMLLSSLRKLTKATQDNLQWLTNTLGNIVSIQTTSSRTHDLKRLARQTTIRSNALSTSGMDFGNLSCVLEEHASKLGVLLVNIRTDPYMRYISESLYLTENCSASGFDTCFLDPRILYLEGLDAGIVLEASQAEHSGPLAREQNQGRVSLALPYLNKNLGNNGSMLAWVCWDEFVLLQTPYIVRWTDKCNDGHIAALRIIMKNTISEAVSSRSVTGLEGSSTSTAQLMGALLMIAMYKLVETRITVPVASSDTDAWTKEVASPQRADSVTTQGSIDTSILLMRGLFGNLLTIAGSGTPSMSYVWQLFRGIPGTFDIPTSTVAWSWYENTTRLLPYTGWSLELYKANIVGLLDKLILRMMTKNEVFENVSLGGLKRIAPLQKYCKDRNINLHHSRTITTILEKMLAEQNDSQCQVSAQRLLQIIPEYVEDQTQSYSRFYYYIQHLAQGGAQRSHDNVVAALVFTNRSAVFSAGKKRLAGLLSEKHLDEQKIIETCQHLLDTKTAIEKAWGLEAGVITMPSTKRVQTIIDASLTKAGPFQISPDVIRKARSDPEIAREPWQTFKMSQHGEIEKLDSKLVTQVLGQDSNAIQLPMEAASTTNMRSDVDDNGVLVGNPGEEEYLKYQGSFKKDFLQDVGNAEAVEDVCGALGVTIGAMEAFMEMLMPDRKMEIEASLPWKFKQMVLMLMQNRGRNAGKVKPTNMLLDLPC